jgi:hypothetical protein
MRNCFRMSAFNPLRTFSTSRSKVCSAPRAAIQRQAYFARKQTSVHGLESVTFGAAAKGLMPNSG